MIMNYTMYTVSCDIMLDKYCVEAIFSLSLCQVAREVERKKIIAKASKKIFSHTLEKLGIGARKECQAGIKACQNVN